MLTSPYPQVAYIKPVRRSQTSKQQWLWISPLATYFSPQRSHEPHYSQGLSRETQPNNSSEIKWSNSHLSKREMKWRGSVHPSLNKGTHRSLTRCIRAISESKNNTVKALHGNHLLHKWREALIIQADLVKATRQLNDRPIKLQIISKTFETYIKY